MLAKGRRLDPSRHTEDLGKPFSGAGRVRLFRFKSHVRSSQGRAISRASGAAPTSLSAGLQKEFVNP